MFLRISILCCRRDQPSRARISQRYGICTLSLSVIYRACARFTPGHQRYPGALGNILFPAGVSYVAGPLFLLLVRAFRILIIEQDRPIFLFPIFFFWCIRRHEVPRSQENFIFTEAWPAQAILKETNSSAAPIQKVLVGNPLKILYYLRSRSLFPGAYSYLVGGP